MTWVEGAEGSGYDVDHLPLGVVELPDLADRDGHQVATRIGEHVLTLTSLAAAVTTPDEVQPALACRDLGTLLAAGPATWAALREWLTGLLTDDTHRDAVAPHLHAVADTRSLLPFAVADFVDFYCSEHHARRVGEIMRPDGEPLLPNWRHLPVGYHGRAGTVVVSGTPVRRPYGQRRTSQPDGEGRSAEYAPSRRLDLEAELGFVVGPPTAPGTRLRPDQLADHVFGVVALNDWSARDIQGWEYAPLGPFLGKAFATSIAGWVTPLAALEAARVPLPDQQPPPLPHLAVNGPGGYDVAVELRINGEVVSRPAYATTYWGPGQMLVHLTSGGLPLRSGDLFGSGTISGPGDDERGCLLELTHGGRQPVRVGDVERTFLEDGDEVTIAMTAPGTLPGSWLQLAEVTGTVLPADG
ncbi:fumarylacetoacetase [Nocardioides massiliensis]|uniref:fumarylacetoacetase n=3 Tax=Nocardioides massiliensis TaxID=1325935 RepID=A0ABT9NKF1_9ACTN|nr:fumarylacetoacetate hydrolase family protein [Nocardioides massiliensis]MDP9820899.1 fumarylacetoacetase [Nocardioides massiliensis]